MEDIISLLEKKNIRPTAQRIAVAQFVLKSTAHPSADQIWEGVKRRSPAISRATCYNVLDLFVRKGLLKRQLLRPGMVVFDPLTEPHHHFIDSKTGKIYDIPLKAIKIKKTTALRDFDLKDYHIVMRGRKKSSA